MYNISKLRLSNVTSRLKRLSLCERTAATSASQTYTKGQKVNGYTIQKVEDVPELYLSAIHLVHDDTGAQHLHVDRDDSNNSFGVSFRTTPMDHTGVPHILEHTALCGSQKFPVRDPFFKMLNRSLSTFMNAFTASDWTMYPFSTQNRQDFKNLMDVYLDAAFFPRLSQMDFRQEGWRLEHADSSDVDSPIIFKGVVFNEMKGVFSNSQQLFCQKMQNFLLPGHTYSVVSGGDPKHIPDLSWQQLKDFHASHYHPSNARFYTYGNFPLEEHLEVITKEVLNKFQKINPGTEVPSEQKWKQPREEVIRCGFDPMAPDQAKQTTVAVSYLCNDVTDAEESFLIGMIGQLLTSGEKAPFYSSLIESNIGSDYAPTLGYDTSTRDATFSVGLQGIKSEDVQKVKDIIKDTFDQVVRDGFEQERIDAIVHKIELSQKHQYDQFGLYLGVSLLSNWNHDSEPIEGLHVNKQIEKFKRQIAENPRFLQEKVQQYFVDNNHKLTLVMTPDHDFEPDRLKEESTKLESMLETLSQGDRDQLYKDGKALAALQDAEEDLSCLPTLKVKDIDRKGKDYTIDTIKLGGVPVQSSEQPTNGLAYFSAITNTRDLPAQAKPYIPLFCSVLTKMGTNSLSFRELSQREDLYTGGLAVSPHVSDHHTDSTLLEEGIGFASFALERNVEHMFDLWSTVFNEVNFADRQRLMTLIMISASELANSIPGSGHQYAMSHAASHICPASKLREVYSGMTQVALMRRVAEQSDLTPTMEYLKQIADHVLNRNNLRVALNATPQYMAQATEQTEKFILGLSKSTDALPTIMSKVDDYHGESKNTQFSLPFQVNYLGKAIKTVPYSHKDFASLRVLARLMTNKFLHKEIREKGGAYGGGAVGSQGLFNMYSFRDPNSITTIAAFNNAVQWAEKGEFSQQDIDEAKLSIFAKIDSPVSPGQRGLSVFSQGIIPQLRQQNRERLFQVNKEQLVDAAVRYLAENKQPTSVTLLGPENALLDNQSNWNTIQT